VTRIDRIRREARILWAFWSVRLAALAGMIAAYVVADPTVLTALVVYVPDSWRPLAAAGVGFFVFALPTLARRLPQPKLNQKPEDKP
jgi:hypothetical protein